MLHLHFSNRFDTLAQRLLDRLGAPAAAGAAVFGAETVIVPSAAVRRRLTLAIADAHGVCAGVEFAWLAHWLWQCMRRVLPGLPAQSPLDPALMRWQLLAAFEAHAGAADATGWADHPRLAAWLAAADGVMRLQFAQQVAALFDQYATYRPQWLQAWAEGEGTDEPALDATARADAAWQAALWRRLAAGVPPLHRQPVPAFEAALQQHGPALVHSGALPPRLAVFALPAMPPLHLRLLQALGRVIELDVYVLNPCREYWFDLVAPRHLATLRARGQAGHHEVGQPLLAAWGRQLQSQLQLLDESSGEHVDDDAEFVPHGGATLLGRLHDAVLELADPAPGSVVLAPHDRSIELHVCHSRTRELEVLQDRLLGLLAGPDAPAPGQILVVTPDLEATAPLIEAVFGTAPPGRHIPYTITGRARSRANGIARALLQLLALPDSRCGASEVFGLLQQAPVARRFGLDADALQRVHDWLHAAGVHWALDESHRAALGLPGAARHGFADGLERLLLGYALPDAVDPALVPFAGLLPAGGAEGSQALWLGALGSFIERLQALRRHCSGALPAPQWPPLLAQALDDFIRAAPDELDDRREVDAALQRVARQWQQTGLALPLRLDAVAQVLADELDDPARGGVPGGTLTFAPMASLRALPYRALCIIGLDDGAFPGSARAAEFDLVARAPKLGDRQRRDDERNLFLDLVLAAQDVLHLSHTGRSVRDNAPLPPSVLVSELLDALAPWIADDARDPKALARARARLVVEHPLQAFAERAFRIDSPLPLRSFHQEYCEALQQRAGAAAPPPGSGAAGDGAGGDADADADAEDTGDDSDERATEDPQAPFFATALAAPGAPWRMLTLQRLAEFFRSPCRFLLRRRLGLELQPADEPLQDDEALLPDLPTRSALAARLLPPLLAGADAPTLQRLALAGTDWPAGALAREALARELAELQRFGERVRALQAAPLQPPHGVNMTLDVSGQPWHLEAGFADLRPTGLVRHRYDNARAGDFLGTWLQHLLLCAAPPAGVAPVTQCVTRDGMIRFAPVADAPALLQALLGLMARGLVAPLYFFPRSAWAYVDHGDSLAQARSAWQGGQDARFGESQDPACRLALRGLPDPLGDGLAEFTTLAHAVYDPLRDALECRP